MVSDVTTPELAPLLTTTPHQREDVSQLSTDLTCIAALHTYPSVVLDRTHDMPAMVGYLNHWATAAPSTCPH
ncbi:hypothetical protein TNCV_462331 [Trichonephila clavipes]|uniref:Uncharacterized protein n=1 Tax=Trichonephila clavipes TaxID=2585209 RepID=A0A8X6UWX3_TRICX|nr:hypothetical protein TNCV_462331 [Trichonephila clavipes]